MEEMWKAGIKPKYHKWIESQLKLGYNSADILGTVEMFDDKSVLLPKEQRDIYVWDGKELEEALKNLSSNRQTRKSSRGKYVKMFEDDRFLVVRVDDQEAAIYWGVGTRWCITQENSSYYNNYRDNGNVFYYLIDKEAENKALWSKVAIVMGQKSPEYYASDDSSHPYNSLPAHIKSFLKRKS